MLGNFMYCNPTKLYFGEQALNTFVAMGKATDWEAHMIGQSIGAYCVY